MKEESSPFQLIVLGIFGLMAVAGVLYFSMAGFSTNDNTLGPIRIWGTIDDAGFNAVIRQLAEDDARLSQVVYERRDVRTYQTELVEALASGKGPDLFLLTNDYVYKHEDKLFPIPYDRLPLRTFEETFVDGASVFLTPQGAVGIPIAVDPMVLYWNKDLLAADGFVSPPKYWDELFTIAEKVTRKDEAKTIQTSAVSFGEYTNVLHAKDILATLIMQANGEIVVREEDGRVRSRIASALTETQQPAQSALRFFTEFANPTKTVYSWNRSLPNSRDAFIAGDLALYVGFAGELPLLKSQNPNLSFSVAPLPQVRGTSRAVTYGRMYALAIPKTAANPANALSAAFLIASRTTSELLAEARGTPSPRRDILIEQKDGTDSVFRDSAIIARTWLDPDPARTGDIFRDMVESVTTGARRLADSVKEADRALSDMLEL